MPFKLFRKKNTLPISEEELDREVEVLQKKADGILESAMGMLKDHEQGIIDREKVMNLCNQVKIFRNTYILNSKNPTEYLAGLDNTFSEILRVCGDVLEGEDVS